jgi:hypothetical protein
MAKKEHDNELGYLLLPKRTQLLYISSVCYEATDTRVLYGNAEKVPVGRFPPLITRPMLEAARAR